MLDEHRAELFDHPARGPDTGMVVLNPLEQGGRCVITTHDMRTLAGCFRGIEVAHGDRYVLVEGHGSNKAILVESVLSASGPGIGPPETNTLDGSRSGRSQTMFSKLHVGNLTYDTTSADLQALFAQRGEVKEAHVVTDVRSGRSRGYGFVEMATPDDARTAISALDGHNVDGRDITVAIAKPRSS